METPLAKGVLDFFFWNNPVAVSRFSRAASRTAACEPRASPGRSEPRSLGRAATKHSPPAARSSRAPHRAASSTLHHAPLIRLDCAVAAGHVAAGQAPHRWLPRAVPERPGHQAHSWGRARDPRGAGHGGRHGRLEGGGSGSRRGAGDPRGASARRLEERGACRPAPCPAPRAPRPAPRATPRSLTSARARCKRYSST